MAEEIEEKEIVKTAYSLDYELFDNINEEEPGIAMEVLGLCITYDRTWKPDYPEGGFDLSGYSAAARMLFKEHRKKIDFKNQKFFATVKRNRENGKKNKGSGKNKAPAKPSKQKTLLDEAEEKLSTNNPKEPSGLKNGKKESQKSPEPQKNENVKPSGAELGIYGLGFKHPSLHSGCCLNLGKEGCGEKNLVDKVDNLDKKGDFSSQAPRNDKDGKDKKILGDKLKALIEERKSAKDEKT